MERPLIQNSVLLNKPGYHTTAAAAIHLAKGNTYSSKLPYISGSLSISDCSRTINLDLDINNKKEYKNTLYKLSVLEGLIQEARVKLEEYQPVYNLSYRKAKKKNKKDKLKAKLNSTEPKNEES